MKTKILCLIQLLVFFPTLVFAQLLFLSNNVDYISTQVERGFIWQHRPEEMQHIFGHPTMASVSMVKRLNGKKTWHQVYNMPQVGCKIAYLHLDSPFLGDAIGVMPFIEMRIWNTPNYQMLVVPHYGVGYTTNPFHITKNPQNTAISSPIGHAAQLQYIQRWKLHQLMQLETQLSLTHFSNGAFRMPNLGINVLSAGIGLRYKLHEKNINSSAKQIDTTYDNVKKGWRIQIATFGGVHSKMPPYRQKLYPQVSLQCNAIKQLGKSHIVSIGLEGNYSQSLQEEVQNRLQKGDLTEKVDFKQAGLTIGHALLFGKMSIIMQIGGYLYQPFKYHFPLYQRYGFRYYATQHLAFNLTLKAHLAVADCNEFGLTYTF